MICSLMVCVGLVISTSVQAETLTLEQVMADPDWLGNAPQNAYWADDGQAIYYWQKIEGNKERQLWKMSLANKQAVKVSDKERFEIDSPNGVLSPNGKLKAYNLEGDLYLKYLDSGDVRQLTRTHANEGRPQFIGDATVAYRSGEDFYAIELNTGLINQLVDIRLEDLPKTEQELESAKSYLDKQQSRYFEYIRKQQNQAKHNRKREQELADSSERDASAPFYLGNKDIHTLSLSPNGRWLIVGTYEKSDKTGENDNMPRFVTEDGYVENQKVRPLVGTYKPRNETLYLLDLQNNEQTVLDYKGLPYIENDPLADIKRATAQRNGEEYKPHKGVRGVAVFDWIPNNGIEWNADGSNVAIMLYSDDNKDRWITTLDTSRKQLVSAHHIRDEAWVNDWNFNDFGWVDNKTLYYTSEETGFSQLYTKAVGGKAKAVTKGRFIVDSVQKDHTSNHLYYRANKKHPGVYEVYKVNLDNGKSQAVTDLGGKNDYVLSPNGQQLIIEHSEALRHPDLYLIASHGGEATRLTDTMSEKFKKMDWVQPEFIEVPSREADAPIYARLYKPKDFDASRADKYPAVIFIHGAGYLQNAHQGWSLYFREFMFHTFLTQKGYVVLDMDYRASAGYGRDWRTAIYRQMGTPEVIDLQDGADWLATNANVNRNKVGIYGGSYGGFLTFMALFTAPDAFAAGASLRPVTDWAHYNHPYTSNILNTPEVDPIAFERSSPIEFAEGLNKPLLIAHGMVDDNVFFKDSVRLVQRLIELEKTEYFETAIYPIEPHGFTEPSSWLDEYKRIYFLFERTLK
ncbi:MAG: S9 family peptidase [Kangiellaceae bacterium]|nr:S9 family peptidase [Kangiellaceae bacterium]